MSNILYWNFSKQSQKWVEKTKETSSDNPDTTNVFSLPQISENIANIIKPENHSNIFFDYYPMHVFIPFITWKIPELLKSEIGNLHNYVNDFFWEKHPFIISERYFSDKEKDKIQESAKSFAFFIKHVFDFTVNQSDIWFSYEEWELEEAIEHLIWDYIFESLYELWEEKVELQGIELSSFDEEEKILEHEELYGHIFVDESDILAYNFEDFYEKIEKEVDKVILDGVQIFNTTYPQFQSRQPHEDKIERYLWSLKETLSESGNCILKSFEYLAKDMENPIKFDDIVVLMKIMEVLQNYQEEIVEELYEICK